MKQPECAELAVRVTPRASRERVEWRAGVLRVYVCSPPVDGAANSAVVRVVAKTLGVAKSTIDVTRGAASRDKLLSVRSLTPTQLAARLQALHHKH